MLVLLVLVLVLLVPLVIFIITAIVPPPSPRPALLVLSFVLFRLVFMRVKRRWKSWWRWKREEVAVAVEEELELVAVEEEVVVGALFRPLNRQCILCEVRSGMKIKHSALTLSFRQTTIDETVCRRQNQRCVNDPPKPRFGENCVALLLAVRREVENRGVAAQWIPYILRNFELALKAESQPTPFENLHPFQLVPVWLCREVEVRWMWPSGKMY
ncbi:hypothetical protein EV361DRAFT_869411 [Lentinula raphanica]|nr:hypothetical protein EV361DRAFT_869411 [Lentinula raphanica]